MSTKNKLSTTLDTKVGCDYLTSTRFRGQEVNEDFVPRHGFWSLVFISIQVKNYTEEWDSLFDQLSAAVVSADPHVWPLKLARIVASSGSIWDGIYAGMTSVGAVGCHPRSIRDMVLWIEENKAELDSEKTENFIRNCGYAFRILGRRRDIRSDRVAAVVTSSPLDLPMTLNVLNMLEKRADFPHVYLLIALIFHDLSFTPQQADFVAALLFLPNFIANVWEEVYDSKVQGQWPVLHPARSGER